MAVRALLAGGILGIAVMGVWWAPQAVRYSSGGLRGEESTRAVPITSEQGDEEWPRFSPDGTRIAFLWRQDPPDASAIASATTAKRASRVAPAQLLTTRASSAPVSSLRSGTAWS